MHVRYQRVLTRVVVVSGDLLLMTGVRGDHVGPERGLLCAPRVSVARSGQVLRDVLVRLRRVQILGRYGNGITIDYVCRRFLGRGRIGVWLSGPFAWDGGGGFETGTGTLSPGLFLCNSLRDRREEVVFSYSSPF